MIKEDNVAMTIEYQVLQITKIHLKDLMSSQNYCTNGWSKEKGQVVNKKLGVQVKSLLQSRSFLLRKM